MWPITPAESCQLGLAREKERLFMKKLLGFALILFMVGFAQASMVTYNDDVSLQTTNWYKSMDIPKFDPLWGSLYQIDFSLTGTVEGSAKYENLDASPQTITLKLQAKVTLWRPDLTVIVVVQPLVDQPDNAAAFDNVIDFDGDSGNTFDGLTNTATESVSSTDPADFALFTGIGNITLPVWGEAMSTASGGGNLISQFTTNAGAEAKVTYYYNIPEPMTLSLLGLGAMVLVRKRMA